MNGIIIIYKPKGWTSHDIVAKVKNLTQEKVGHTGTLDPLATGVLPLLIGKGTLCSKYLINHDKKYKVTLKLGKKTSTGDEEGEIIEEQNVSEQILEQSNIEEVLKKIIGEQEQIPPIYSAIKVKGKKLYEYARNNQEVKIEPRKITIYEINLLKIDKDNNEIQFKVKCSKGTYIRRLCEDIAKALGTVGYMKELERTEVGDFKLEQSISIDDLISISESDKNKIEEKIIGIEELFNNLENIELNKVEDKVKALHGNLMEVVNDKADIVVAYIIADIIKILAKDIKNFMKDDAVFISSGIIHAKVDEVKASLEENGLEVIEVQSLGEWNAIVSKIK